MTGRVAALLLVLLLAGCASTCPPKPDGSPGKCQQGTIWSSGALDSLPVLWGWW